MKQKRTIQMPISWGKPVLHSKTYSPSLNCGPSKRLWAKGLPENGSGMTSCHLISEQRSRSKKPSGKRESGMNSNKRVLNTRTNSRIIFELIKGEMAYVKDLENMETVCGPSNQLFVSNTSFRFTSSRYVKLTRLSFLRTNWTNLLRMSSTITVNSTSIMPGLSRSCMKSRASNIPKFEV